MLYPVGCVNEVSDEVGFFNQCWILKNGKRTGTDNNKFNKVEIKPIVLLK